MSHIDETPIITSINEGEITSSLSSINNPIVKVDLFNGKNNDLNKYLMTFNPTDKKYTIGNLTPLNKNFYLGDCFINGELNLTKDSTQQTLGYHLIVGTHIGEQKPSTALLENIHTIKCDDTTIKAKFDFVYVQVTAGVSDSFGTVNYRKSSENTIDTPKNIKTACDRKGVKVGFTHYLTGNNHDAKDIGKNQARKFVDAILGNSANKDYSVLDGTMRPIVVFKDNITQVGFYGAAPIGVKKDF